MAKKKSTVVSCDCIEKVNEQLTPYNAAVDAQLRMNLKTGASAMCLYVPLRKIDSKNKKRLPSMPVTFCPFCGKKWSMSATPTPPEPRP